MFFSQERYTYPTVGLMSEDWVGLCQPLAASPVGAAGNLVYLKGP